MENIQTTNCYSFTESPLIIFNPADSSLTSGSQATKLSTSLTSSERSSESTFVKQHQSENWNQHQACSTSCIPSEPQMQTTSKRRPRKPRKRLRQAAPTAPRTFDCEFCTETFHLKNLLRLHKRTVHVLSKPFSCQQCSQQFNFEKNFRLHTASHLIHGSPQARCPECQACFQRSATFRGHLATHMINDSFQCKKCEYEFEYEEYYRRHLDNDHFDVEADSVKEENRREKKAKNAVRNFQCDICLSGFTKPSNLARHRLIHTKQKSFQCNVCSMKFTQKGTLQRHQLRHSGVKSFKCPKCSMRFSQRSNLQAHMRRVHPRNPDLTNKFPCSSCSCVFSKLSSLNRHSAKIHTTKLSVIAEENDEDDVNACFEMVMAQLKRLQPGSAGNDSLSSESLFPNGNSTVPVIGSATLETRTSDLESDSCVKMVESQNEAQEKSAVVVKVEELNGCKYYCCDICSKKFRRPYELLRHTRIHTGEKPYECGICGRCFALKNTLLVHLRIHGKQSDKITNCYQCSECFTQFSSLRQLDSHVSIHEGLKLFSCSICGKSFHKSNNLQIHEYKHRPRNAEEQRVLKAMRKPTDSRQSVTDESHPGRSYQCMVCDLPFKSFAQLKEHEFRHSGQKPFLCLMCNRQFSTRSSLKTHRKIHSSHKTKQCHVCNASFRTNTELRRHQTVHSSIRSVFCSYCLKSFKTRGTCKAHFKTHAKDLVRRITADNRPECNLSEYCFVSSDQQDYDASIKPTPESTLEVMSQMDDVTLPKIPESIEITSSSPFEPKESSKFIEINDLLTKPSSKSLKKTITIHSIERHPDLPPTSLLLQNPEETRIPPANGEVNRKHACETCGKAFKKPIDLRRHHLTHTKEKPFACNSCNATFSLKSILARHQLTHSERRTKFDCQVCGKQYATQGVLKVHLRLHTNELPYKCQYCDKSFRTTGHRDSHVRGHVKLMENRKKLKRKGK